MRHKLGQLTYLSLRQDALDGVRPDLKTLLAELKQSAALAKTA